MEDNTRAWWKDAAERLAWTFVQGALAVLTADQFGLIDLVDGELWKAAAAGGFGSVLSFIKSIASVRTSQGGTAQLGARTYSYTEEGPGSAGADAGDDDADAGEMSVQQILVVVLLVFLILFIATRVF